MTLFAIELVLYAVGTVFVIFMLVSERTVTRPQGGGVDRSADRNVQPPRLSEATARMIEREANAGRPVTVMIFDIDHFKSINDRFGHPAGDEMLKLFATIVTNSLRISDLCGRIGGEEFAALLPCPMDEALTAAERVREAFQNCGIAVDDAPVETTVSSASPAARRIPSSKCCWPRPTPRCTGQARRPQPGGRDGGGAAVAGAQPAQGARSRATRNRSWCASMRSARPWS